MRVDERLSEKDRSNEPRAPCKLVIMIDNVNDDTVRAVANHEAAHIVIACALGLSIGEKGATVCGFPPDPTGVAHFEGATQGTEVVASKADDVIIALLAGGIAHSKLRSDVKTAVLRDEERIAELLGSPSFTSPEVQAHCGLLKPRANELVDRHWPVIETVAMALCSKEWHYRRPANSFFKEKSLSGADLKSLLDPMPVMVNSAIE
jgi:hypothetical protein